VILLINEDLDEFKYLVFIGSNSGGCGNYSSPFSPPQII